MARGWPILLLNILCFAGSTCASPMGIRIHHARQLRELAASPLDTTLILMKDIHLLRPLRLSGRRLVITSANPAQPRTLRGRLEIEARQLALENLRLEGDLSARVDSQTLEQVSLGSARHGLVLQLEADQLLARQVDQPKPRHARQASRSQLRVRQLAMEDSQWRAGRLEIHNREAEAATNPDQAKCLLRNVLLDNCQVILDGLGGPLEHLTLTRTARLEADPRHPSTFRRSIVMGELHGASLPADGRNWTAQLGDPKLTTEGELRWDSPCLDRLPDERDFDLTRGDVGWHPVYEVKPLAGRQIVGGRLHGWFQVEHEAELLDDSIELAAGSVIRVAAGGTLQLATGAGPGCITLGDSMGARTALVGATQSEPGTTAARLALGPAHSLTYKAARLEGLLIHGGFHEELALRHLRVELDARQVRILPDVTGALRLIQLEGRLRGLRFGDSPGNGRGAGCERVEAFRGRVEVERCEFAFASQRPGSRVNLHRVLAGHPLEGRLRECRFPQGRMGQSRALTLSQCVARLEECEFQARLDSRESSLQLDNGAHNVFMNIHMLPDPLVAAQGGRLHLCQGRNRFIQSADFAPMLTHNGREAGFVSQEPWDGNYWSSCCGQGMGIQPGDLLPRTALRHPRILADCPLDSVAVEPCPPSPGARRLERGVDKELSGDLAGAQADYQAVLNLGVTDESTEAALRLQSLGGSSEYGAENYESIRTGLLTASALVAPTDPGLSTLYACNAWTVEAEHGDFETAIAQLESIRDAATTPEDRFNAELAIEEANIVGTPSGLSATSASLSDRRERATKRLFELMDAGPGVGVAQETSSRPREIELGAAYPNPFNPVTTLPITLGREQEVSVAVYNVLGQQVATLLNGRLAAGTHSVRFDGQSLSSGLYLVQVKAEDGVRSRKVMLLQ